jgi:hypothetical protein
MKSWLFLPLLVSFSVQCLASNITIITSRVPNGTVDTAYSAAIKANNGCTPYKWKIVSGTLPTGITARASSNTTSFNLTGIPTKAVTDSFVVKATGCGGGVSQASYKIVIQSTANHVVNLDWNASTSTDVVGYNVYRSPDAATWKKINVSLIGPRLYSDSTVANSSTYYYAAAAVDIEGHESGKTSPVKVVVP